MKLYLILYLAILIVNIIWDIQSNLFMFFSGLILVLPVFYVVFKYNSNIHKNGM